MIGARLALRKDVALANRKLLSRFLGCLFIFALPFTAAVPAVAQSPRPAAAVQVMEATIAELQQWMTEGKTTSKALVQAYLERIEAYDARGPRLNAILAINANALKEAEELDRERAAKGPRGPLHGIPIIVKDNYDTASMPTTAGSPALAGFIPSDDSFQIRKLREAGAVILAKSNMHELASGIINHQRVRGANAKPLRSGSQSRRIERRNRRGHRRKLRRRRYG